MTYVDDPDVGSWLLGGDREDGNEVVGEDERTEIAMKRWLVRLSLT